MVRNESAAHGRQRQRNRGSTEHTAKIGDHGARSKRSATVLLGFDKDVTRGLKIRSDWGPQYTDAWTNKWLGITIVPSYVGA